MKKDDEEYEEDEEDEEDDEDLDYEKYGFFFDISKNEKVSWDVVYDPEL